MRAAKNDECYLRSKLVEIAVVGQKPVPRLVGLSNEEIKKIRMVNIMFEE